MVLPKEVRNHITVQGLEIRYNLGRRIRLVKLIEDTDSEVQ
jgi:hypothetical protein